MYIQHDGVSDTVYTKWVSFDGTVISSPTFTVWFVLLNSTLTCPKKMNKRASSAAITVMFNLKRARKLKID